MMKEKYKLFLGVVLSALLLFQCDENSSTEPEQTKSTTQTITVEAKSNIWAAGHSVLPPSINDLSGDFPPMLDLTSVASRPLTFSSISGTVNGRGSGEPNGSDGKVEGAGSNITALQGISGIIHDTKVMFLAGVFLDDSEPADPAPDTIDFSEMEYDVDIHPSLKQVFFIGDGLTGTGEGEVQEFFIPEGATRLFFGFADAYNFTGAPGFYNDNSGKLTVVVNL
jgi:hypothetical protein